MKSWIPQFLVVTAFLGTVSIVAQDKPAALSPEEQALVQAVMALQQTASAACDALPAVKQYAEVLTKANAAFAKSGRTIDWRTGTLAPPKPETK